MTSKFFLSILGSTVLAGNGFCAQNLIIQGDFETGISGGGYGSYSNEIGTFANGDITNNTVVSNWLVTSTYQGTVFRNLLTPSSTGSWGARIGGYTDSYLTYTTILNLTAGEYNFTADHWAEPENSTGSQFTATLIYLGTDSVADQIIDTFTDETAGSIESHDFNFNLIADGEYQLQLSGVGDGIATDPLSRAWVDNISLTPVPEPSSYALLIGLVGLSLAFYRRYKQVKV